MPTIKLSPWEISLSALSELLSSYDSTLARVYRDKLAAKAGKAAKAAKSSIPKAKEKDVEDRLKLFVELDGWRYTTLPAILLERAASNEDNESKGETKHVNGYINKDELVRLMDWKLKHGSFRPALMGLIRSNPEPQVESISKDAFSKLAEAAGAGVFPESSLQLLCKGFRGVGPATASLVLSLAPHTDAHQTPFFSDELYYWLCLDLYSSGKRMQKHNLPKLRYNLKEYQDLWDAFSRLRIRIQKLSEESKTGHSFSMQDIEKIAFVAGHLEAASLAGGDSKDPSKPDPEPSPTKLDREDEKDQGRRTRKRKRKDI
ncbi:hypothetical protein MauCBS54593_005779 [Microsporum audouinii]